MPPPRWSRRSAGCPLLLDPKLDLDQMGETQPPRLYPRPRGPGAERGWMEEVRDGAWDAGLSSPGGGVVCRQRGHPGPGTWSKYPCKVPSTGGSSLKSGAQPLHPGLSTPTAQQDLLPSSQTRAAADVFLYLSSSAPAPTCSGTRQVVCTRCCVVGGGWRQAPLWSPPALGAAHIIIPCPPWPLLRWPFGQVARPGLGAPCGHSPWRSADTLEFTWAPRSPLPSGPLSSMPRPGAPQVSSLSREALLRGRDETV